MAETAKKATNRKPTEKEIGLKLYYQPIVQPMFGKTVAYEALIRLFDKKLRFVSPAIFIPIAEKNGMNIALGNWVIEEACRTIHKMEKREIKFEYISLNISNRHFQKRSFEQDVVRIAKQQNVEPEKLCFEISEEALTSKSILTVQKLQSLRDLGFKLAIDDYSGELVSLAKLGSIPVDILKLDKRFADNIVFNAKSKAQVEEIISRADELGLEVIAKAVEDSKQQTMFMEMGCRKMQGFLFEEPLRERDIFYPKKSRAGAPE